MTKITPDHLARSDLNPGELRSDGYGASINDQLFSMLLPQ
jgi:hypothetical protein